MVTLDFLQVSAFILKTLFGKPLQIGSTISAIATTDYYTLLFGLLLTTLQTIEELSFLFRIKVNFY